MLTTTKTEKERERFNLSYELLYGRNLDTQLPVYQWEDRMISREVLALNVERTAAYFRMLGVQAGERVLILLQDTPALVEVFLGSIVIGAIPIVLNPHLSNEELEYIYQDSESSLMVVEQSDRFQLEMLFASNPHLGSRNRLIIQDRYCCNNTLGSEYFYPRLSKIEFIEEDDLADLYRFCHADEVCFWQYTSGTTGNPKAIMHSHFTMISNTLSFAEGVLSIGPGDRIYSVPKLFFGYGMGNSLFFPIYLGAVALLDHHWFNTCRFEENVSNFNPSIIFGVPKVYSLLLHEGVSSDFYQAVRIFYSAGSNLQSSINQGWYQHTGKYINQGLGCTEIGHVFISTLPNMPAIHATGVPLDGFQVRLKNSEHVDGFLAGELEVCPAFNLLGYWNQPNEQEQKFNSNWYSTGDYVKQNADGQFIHVSRCDELFKVNGRMVAPSKLESLLAKVFGIHDVVYFSLDAGIADVRTILMWADPPGRSILEEQLAGLIKKELPSIYMPNEWIKLDELPRNSNGKIDRTEIRKIAKKSILNQLKQI